MVSGLKNRRKGCREQQTKVGGGKGRVHERETHTDTQTHTRTHFSRLFLLTFTPCSLFQEYASGGDLAEMTEALHAQRRTHRISVGDDAVDVVVVVVVDDDDDGRGGGGGGCGGGWWHRRICRVRD